MPGRNRGRRGGGGGGPPSQSREVTVSKALSFVLRHGAEAEGIELDEGGWANVRDVVGCLLSTFVPWVVGFVMMFACLRARFLHVILNEFGL